MGLQGKNTAEWFARGKAALVNGVSSGFRYWGDDDTLVIDHGEGAYVFDMDGNRYIDYVGSWGPMILGHAHPAVISAVQEAAGQQRPPAHSTGTQAPFSHISPASQGEPQSGL